MVHASTLVHESKMPNYLGLQIPVMQFWNLDVFENLLGNYPDKEIIQFLKFSWPINHDERQYSNGICENWKGANLHASQVNKYLRTELLYKSVIGPFKANPFVQKIGISPLNTQKKKDSTEKRIVLDLSFFQKDQQ